ncbi:MAG: cupin domain-containing protein [Alphaproteobacteria bacterium]
MERTDEEMNMMRLSATAFFAAGMLAVSAMAAADEPGRYRALLAPLLQTEVDAVGAPIAYPAGTRITAAVVTLAPGQETGWHLHEVPLFVHILEGEVTVDYGAEGVRTFRAGDSVMEAMNLPHNGANRGDRPVPMLAVYMGGSGSADTARVEGRR